MAEELETTVDTQEDPFAKFGGKQLPAQNSSNDPFAAYGGRVLPKKASPPGGGSTSQPSWNGLDLSQSSPKPFSLVTKDEATRQQLVNQQNQNIEGEQKKKDASLGVLKSYMSKLSPEEQQHISDLTQASMDAHANDVFAPVSKEAEDRYKFTQTPIGKTLVALNYLPSKALKGGLQAVRGGAHLFNQAMNGNGAMSHITDMATDELFDKANNAADLGLNKGEVSDIENGGGSVNKALSSAGMAAEFAPAVAGGEALNAPKAMLYLQGVGQGVETAKQLEENGNKLNPLAKEALIQGTGLVNLALANLGESFFGKGVTDAVKNNVAKGIMADAMKESAGKQLTTDSFKELINKKVTDFATKFERAPVEAIKHYNETAKTFIKLNVGNFAVHKAVDAINDTPVFNETPGDLAEGLNKAVTQDAPIFAAIPAAKELTKLFPGSGYKNEVVNSVMADPSRENIDAIKQQLYDHGFSQEKQWTPQEMDATFKHVDEIANVAKSLPRDIAPDKRGKAIDLVFGRNELQKQLDAVTEAKKQLDPSIQDIPTAKETYLTDKIDQANDKLRDIATGKRTTYSQERDDTGEPTGKFLKTTEGKSEKITPSRYELERAERDAKTKPPRDEQAVPNEELPAETPADEPGEAPGTPAPVDETPENNLTQNNHEKSNSESVTEESSRVGEENSKNAENGQERLLSDEQKLNRSRALKGENIEGTDLSKYTPELHREISFNDLGEFLPNDSGSGNGKYDFAENKDMALGQGNNKGVKLTFDSDGIKGGVNLEKPGLAHIFEKGDGEFKSDHTDQTIFRKNLKEITIDPKAKRLESKDIRFNRKLKQLVDEQGWTKTENKDGSVTYKRGELSHTEAVKRDIKFEKDPKKIAKQYYDEPDVSGTKEQAILDYLGTGKINEKDYNRWGDKNALGGKGNAIKRRWIDGENSDDTGLDIHADIISHDTGIPITPEDIIDTINKYSNLKDFADKNQTEVQNILSQRYFELTGRKLTKGITERIGQTKFNSTPKEESDIDALLREQGVSLKELDNDELTISNKGREETAPAATPAEKVATPGTDSGRPDGKDSQGKTGEAGSGGTVESKTAGQAKQSVKTQSLSDEELNRKLELRKKFAGRFNDITNIPTLLADKEFREYAGLVFKEAAGDFKAFSKELIDNVGEKIKEHLPGLFKDLGGDDKQLPKEKSELPDGGNDVKKTILTERAYEGDIQEDVKKYLEEKGLTRKSYAQEERSKQATDFINKFDDAAAFKAVESGDIDGGMAASILAQLQIKNSREMADFPIGSEERDALAKKQADYIALMEKKGYLGGEFNGQLAYEYQNAELDYANVKKQVEKLTGRTLTKEQEAKVKKITAENEKLKVKLKEAEAKLIDETDKALTGEETAAKPVKPKTEYAQKALDAVVRVRAKIRANSYSDATGMVAIVDSGLATVEAALRTGISVTKAIEKGIAYIKSELSKKGIDVWEKEDDFRKDVTDAFAEEGISDSKKERDANDLQQANIKRLEKELANAKENRLKDAPTKREFSDEENDLKEKIKQEKLRISLENLQAAFVDKRDNKFTSAEAKDIWAYMKGKYIENGVSYRDALSKSAEDLGLSWRQMSEAITTPKNKRASDEMWKQQADYARNNNAIKNWIGDQNKSGLWKSWQRVSGLFRGVAVFGHGHIFVGTHAGMTLFNPKTLPLTLKAFLNGWKLAYGKEANYERAMEELKNSPNYLIAQRAGLKNNPERINNEEYQNSQKYLGRLGLVGERGFNAIKILRQDLFDHEFNRLSPAERDDPEVAKSIAHIMNLATGATTLKIPTVINEVTFAGGMEAARWQKLLGNPAKAAEVAFNAIVAPDKATVADRVFAKVWARRVGTQLATFTGALIANAAIQNTLNPQNKVNLTDPDKPDFLKFKFGETTIDPTSGMRSTFAFLYKLGKVGTADEKSLKGEKRSTIVGKDVAKYSLGKLAPVYGTVSDFFNRRDFNNNVMPFSDEKPAKYAHKLSWGEYGTQKLPLPLAEAATVFFQSALEHGAHKKTLDDVLKGIMTGAISGSTGFRVGEYTGPPPDAADKKLSEIKAKTGAKYKLTEPQVQERREIETDYLKDNEVTLTEKFTKEASRSRSLGDKIKEDTALWNKQGVDADLQKQYIKEMTDKFIADKIKEIVNEHSRREILKKYRVGIGVYNLKKAQ